MFNKQIVEAWKDINEDLLQPIAKPMYVLKRALNFTRNVDVVYKGEDGFKYVGKVVKQGVAALFVDPLPLE